MFWAGRLRLRKRNSLINVYVRVLRAHVGRKATWLPCLGGDVWLTAVGVVVAQSAFWGSSLGILVNSRSLEKFHPHPKPFTANRSFGGYDTRHHVAAPAVCANVPLWALSRHPLQRAGQHGRT